MIYKLMVFTSLFFMLCGCSDSRSECDKISDHILSQLAKQMRKKGLYAIGSGGGCTIDKKINLISIVFKYDQIMNIDIARRLIITSTDELLELINSNPNSSEYFESFPPSVSVIYICIIGESPKADASNEIDGVQLIKGNIYYRVDNPNPPPQKDGPLLTVHEETFEEAKTILSQQAEAI